MKDWKAALLLVLVAVAAAVAFPVRAGENERKACQLFSRGELAKHVGETLSFSGTIFSDQERALVVPDGCNFGVGLGLATTPQANAALDSVKPPKGASPITSAIHAKLTGKVTREASNGFQFHKDDGSRFSLSRVDHPAWSNRHL